MIRKFALAATMLAPLTLALVPAVSHALEEPKSGMHDPRVRFISYNPDEVVKVIGRSRASTQIVFAETEQIAHVAIGDSVAWEVAPAQNTLFLKPREQHPPTNLEVITTRANGQRRTYIFELRSSDGAVDGRDHYFAVKFRYPADEAELARLRSEARQGKAEARAVDRALDLRDAFSQRNWAYSAQGARVLQPDAIYDNGRTTVMRFAGNRPIPSIYMVRDDGSESLVPNDVRDNGQMVVVHAMAREFRLRSGKDVICIFNEHYDPQGVNFGTGTTSPAVERQLKNGQ